MFDTSRILAIGPHPDDIELSCFGTLKKFKDRGSQIAVLVMATTNLERKNEALRSAELIKADFFSADLQDTKITDGVESISKIENVINKFRPTLILCPSPHDSHQDHRNTSMAAVSASRYIPTILYYQTPSSTRYFNSQIYIDITDAIHTKLEAVRVHKSQNNVYMADQAVIAQAQFLGFQIYKSGRFFEGFEIHQLICE